MIAHDLARSRMALASRLVPLKLSVEVSHPLPAKDLLFLLIPQLYGETLSVLEGRAPILTCSHSYKNNILYIIEWKLTSDKTLFEGEAGVEGG